MRKLFIKNYDITNCLSKLLFETDEVMQDIFYFLSKEFVLTQLIDASEAGRPAITPVVENVEHFFMDTTRKYTHTLDDNFTKQAIGLMVKTILEPFGYVVWKQKDLPKKSRATKFQSASVYRFNILAPRTMKVVKKIEEIDYRWRTKQEE